MAKILLVEDEVNIASFIERGLQEFGHTVSVAYNGADGWQMAQDEPFDLLVLDIIMPKMNGLDLCRQYRQLYGYDSPVIMLTALGTTDDIVKGLYAGADDYLVKPYSIEDLILKIEIFLTRSQKSNDNSQQKKYVFGSFHFEPENYLLQSDVQNFTLTEREASLLKMFLDNPNTVLKREKILLELWGNDDYFLGRSLDVFISRLRKIIKEETHVRIENIPRVGFRLVVE